VVLFHYGPDLQALAPWLSPLDTFMRAGYLGVDLFFPLSGFILAYNYADSLRTFSWGGTRTFVRNRFARVWPVHVVALHVDLVVAASVGTLGIAADGHRRTLAAYLENLALVHNWWDDRPSFNGPAWSIGSEWFAYLVTPALFVLVARVGRPRSALVGAALSYAAMLGIYAALALPNGNLSHLFFVRILGEFVGGMFLCLAWVRGRVPVGRLWPVLPFALVLAALVPAVSSGNYWLAPLLGLAVAGVAGAGGRLGAWLSAPLLVAAGEGSYALYLTHDLLQPAVRALRSWGDGAWWSASLALAAVAAALGTAAWAMHVLVERPARRLLQARSARSARSGRSSPRSQDAGPRSADHDAVPPPAVGGELVTAGRAAAD
jgi:peptidoglycan/LPS O-acetylase OafA/YrhL